MTSVAPGFTYPAFHTARRPRALRGKLRVHPVYVRLALWLTRALLAAVTIPVAAQAPDLVPPNPRYFATAQLGHVTFFTADSDSHGTELFALTDNPTLQIQRVADIAPGGASSNPRELTVLRDGAVVFSAESASGDVEPWIYDDRQRQAFRLRDVNPAGGSHPRSFTRIGTWIYFSANDGISRTLWRTDGTVGGTTRIAGTPIEPVEPEELVDLSGMLYFTARDNSAGRELWRSDGTPTGTVRVHDIWTGTPDSAPSGLLAYGDRLLFAADDGARGRELWTSDGTSAGTVLLRDIAPGPRSSTPTNLTLGIRILFVANDGVTGRELWRTDGTTAGTAPVKDIEIGPGSSRIEHITWSLVRHFFVAETNLHGAELWVTDGTAAGTTQVADLLPGSRGSSPSTLLADGLDVYFVADDGMHGRELWRSSGTAPTTQLFDLRPGLASSDPTWLHRPSQLGARFAVMFGAENGNDGREVWGMSSGQPFVLSDINSGGVTLPSMEFLTIPRGDGRVTTTIRFFANNDGSRLGQIAISLAPTAPLQLPFLTGYLRVSLAPGQHLDLPLTPNTNARTLEFLLPDVAGVYGDRNSFVIQGFEVSATSPLTASSNGVLAGGTWNDGAYKVVVRDGHYSDRTMRYRLPITMSGPSGAATLGLVYRRAVGADSFEDTIVRVIPYEPTSESRPLTVDGVIDLVPINTSGRKSDKIELRFFSSWPTKATDGQLIWESNC